MARASRPRWPASSWLGLALASLIVVAAVPSSAQGLRVGLGEVEITPPLGSAMAGYTARSGVATSIHDPLLAQVVFFEAADTRVALIALDLRRLTSTAIFEAAWALGVEHVVLASSHTHSGPDADGETGRNSAWRTEMEAKIVEMLRSAMENTFAARLHVGRGATRLAHNRRLVSPEGEVRMLWRNSEEMPTRPLDPGVGVVRITNEEDETRAVLLHFACHPVVLGPDNLALSSDYPGAARRHLAALLTDSPQIVFLQGAAGDLNPYRDKQPLSEGAFDEVEKVGLQLAESAFATLERMKGRSMALGSLRVSSSDLDFDHRWDSEKKVAIRVTTILFGDQLALVAVPGEPFVELQLNLSSRSPVANALMIGYAVSGDHAWPGYLPTMQAAVEGGYGAGYNTHIEVGAGEAIVDRAIIELYSLLGWLDADP